MCAAERSSWNLIFVHNSRLCVTVIQPTIGFIAISGNVAINCAGCADCWKELSSLCVSEMGSAKISI
jgi:hypothetical protein